MTTNNPVVDFDSLLDKSIDDLKDLPSFEIPDTGVYKLRVSLETKAINDMPTVIAHYVVREVVELADSSIPEEQRAKAEDKFDVPFFLKGKDGSESETGYGFLKEFLQPFEGHFNEKHVGKLVRLLAESVDITATVVKKQRKDDKEKFQAQVKDITID